MEVQVTQELKVYKVIKLRGETKDGCPKPDDG